MRWSGEATAVARALHPQGGGLVRYGLSIGVPQKGQGGREVDLQRRVRQGRKACCRQARGRQAGGLYEHYGRRLTRRTGKERLTTTGVPRRARRRAAALPSRTAISSRPLPPTSAPAWPGVR